MKTIKTIILCSVACLLSVSLFSQSYINKGTKNTKLSQLMSQPGTMTSAKFWDLGTISGQDKYEVLFQAVEVGDNKVSDVTKGIKVTVLDDNKKTEAQLSSLFYFGKLETYIDVDEYEAILNSVNYMINTLNIWGNEKMDNGQLYYRTNDNFIFGFEQDGKKQTGYMKIRFDRVEFSCEIKKLSNSLNDVKNYIETASKELYLDANRDKFEQAQKEEEQRLKEAEKAKKEKEKAKKEDKKKKEDKTKDNVDDQL